MLVEINENKQSPAVLKVIGLGGAGGNAVERMIQTDIRGVEFLVANTDIQALNASSCPTKIQIGAGVTGGLGSGGDPSIGRRAAEEDIDSIRERLEGADMVFITAGMGGGTGTGASPLVAEVARQMGALTVAVVTTPFRFEGRKRMRQALDGLEELRSAVDTLIVIQNQRLIEIVDRNTPLTEALKVADDVLTHATKGISEIITVPGLINVDFADVRSVMQGMGNALMGMGFGTGEKRAVEAAKAAISSPLLEDISIGGARGILVNFMGGSDMSLTEVDEAARLVLDAAGEDANVIFGAVVDPNLDGEIRVTLIATGFGEAAEEKSAGLEAARLSGPRDFREPVLSGVGTAGTSARAAALETSERAPSAKPSEVVSGSGVAGPKQAAPGSGLIGLHVAPAGDQSAGAGAKVSLSDSGPAPVSPSGGTAPGLGESQPTQDSLLFEDGVIGKPRPISRVPERSGPGEGPPKAASSTLVPENVVPLVWKKNVSGSRWQPTMSSRWQRVLRRDSLDVPSFMRRRQMD